MRIAAHRPVEKYHIRSVLLQFLNQKRLVHIVARQPIRFGDQDAVQLGTGGDVSQAIQARPSQAGTL